MKKSIYGIALLFALLPLTASADGGQLFLTPNSGTYQIGKPFTVEVLANTDAQAVNAIEADIAYNPVFFAVDSISTDNSVLGTWATAPSYDGASGIISFSGWAPNNYIGTQGLLITITLTPLRAGQSSLDFNSGAMLADDGHGTNIITAMNSGTFNIAPLQVAPDVPAPAPLSTTTPTQATVPAQPDTAVPPPVAPGTPNAAAVSLANNASTTPDSSLFDDIFSTYIPFFILLAAIAFAIAYFFHRKKIAF